MSWTRINLWGVLIGTILVATACSPLGPAPSSEAPKVYLLQWEPPTRDEPTDQLNPACPTLLLSAPRAAPGYAGAGMAYMEEAHRIDYFAHHRWADSPARMLEPLLISALESSGLFRAVVQAPTTARFELRLDTELLRLVQVFEPTESRIEFEMRISLLDTEQQRVLVSDVLAVTEPATERTPYGGVIAANKAVVRLLEELQQVLRPAVQPRCAIIEPAAKASAP
jgi:cholesterol transport system auxiliary component